MNIIRHAAPDHYFHALLTSLAMVVKAALNPLFLLLGIGISFYGAVHNNAIVCGFAVIALLILHTAIWKQPFSEISVIILAGILGACVESINVTLGFYEYGTPTFQDALLPTWIITIWFVIGATIRHAFQWLSRHLLLSAMMGALLGSVVYYIGSKIGVLYFRDTAIRNLMLALLAWILVFPLLVTVGHHMFPQHS